MTIPWRWHAFPIPAAFLPRCPLFYAFSAFWHFRHPQRNALHWFSSAMQCNTSAMHCRHGLRELRIICPPLNRARSLIAFASSVAILACICIISTCPTPISSWFKTKSVCYNVALTCAIISISPMCVHLKSSTPFANACIPTFTSSCYNDMASNVKDTSSKACFVSPHVGAFIGIVGDAIICVDYTGIVRLVWLGPPIADCLVIVSTIPRNGVNPNRAWYVGP